MKKLIVLLLFAVAGFTIFASNTNPIVENQITSPIVESVVQEKTSEKSDQILYVSDKNGNKDIYLMNLRTKKAVNLTTDPSDEMNPQLSPDKQSIVYYSNAGGDNNIYEMRLLTQQVSKLTDNSAEDYDPAYSPDGKFIVFKSTRNDGHGDIMLMKRDGSGVVNLTEKTLKTEEWDPVFAPDGTLYYVVRRGIDHTTDEIHHLDLLTMEDTQLTDNTVADWYPEISPDGKTMIYISKNKNVEDEDLFSMDLVTKDSIRLTYQKGNDADAAFDRTGKNIIFINDKDGDYDIYIMNPDGSGVKKLFDTNDDELSPIFL